MSTDYIKYYSVGDKVYYDKDETLLMLEFEILFIKDNYAFIGVKEEDANYHKVYNYCKWVSLGSVKKSQMMES